MESVTAVSLLLAGSDLLIMRHPESVKLAKEIISELS
jgi:acetyl-CoA decarbonylase/synthase complex subunit delta